jgi:hypothetical protein
MSDSHSPLSEKATVKVAKHAAESSMVPLPTARLGPKRTRRLRGTCSNGGCSRPLYRDTADCFRCWVGVKWTSIIQRIANANGHCSSYVNLPLGFTREQFIDWATKNPPPRWMARPSIDRIVPQNGYAPGNIRWLEMRLNARGSQRDVPLSRRACPLCLRVLTLNAENFHRNRSARRGFNTYCRECRSKQNG